jgi:hypothetical protein
MLRHHSMLLHSSPKPHLLPLPCVVSKQHLRVTNVRFTCAANSQQPFGSSNGSTAPQQQDEDDPVAAMLWAAQQDGVKIVFEEDPDDLDDLEDVLGDLEDPWMRNPSRKSRTAAVIWRLLLQQPRQLWSCCCCCCCWCYSTQGSHHY